MIDLTREIARQSFPFSRDWWDAALFKPSSYLAADLQDFVDNRDSMKPTAWYKRFGAAQHVRGKALVGVPNCRFKKRFDIEHYAEIAQKAEEKSFERYMALQERYSLSSLILSRILLSRFVREKNQIIKDFTQEISNGTIYDDNASFNIVCPNETPDEGHFFLTVLEYNPQTFVAGLYLVLDEENLLRPRGGRKIELADRFKQWLPTPEPLPQPI